MQKWLDETSTQGPYNTVQSTALDRVGRKKPLASATAHEDKAASAVATLGSRKGVDDVRDKGEEVCNAEIVGIGAQFDGCSK